MGRLRVLSGREVCRILGQHGFLEVRRRGSHVIMQRADPGNHTELKIGTLLSIIRQSRLLRGAFEVEP